MPGFKRSELEALNIPVKDMIADFAERMKGNNGNPAFDDYADGVYLGANEAEGRTEEMFFKTKAEFEQWLIQNS